MWEALSSLGEVGGGGKSRKLLIVVVRLDAKHCVTEFLF